MEVTPKQKSAVTREVAIVEIDNWLDQKKVYPSTRETCKADIDLLIDAMVAGDLILDNGSFKHKLLFPLEGLIELTYKPRLNDAMVKPHMQGVKNGDGDGRLAAHTAALTSQPKRIIESLDSADKKIMMSIMVFFL
jgi:hypothetical protein